jgi:hypothetical protein
MDSESFAVARRIFVEARELPAERRSAFVRSECGDREDVRREVESLLAAAGADGTFLGGGGVAVAAEAVRAMREWGDADDSHAWGIGSSDVAAGGAARVRRGPLPEWVGDYRVLGRIGSGAMGDVYEAEQQHPRRVVALKVIRPGLITDERVRRFARETEILGRLRHPGVASVFLGGTASPVTADGARGTPQPFLAMELVRGRSLTEYATVKDLSVDDRLALIARVCDAVQHAHDNDVVHRDLKPSNILVEDKGQPKVLDFGVARATDSDLHAATVETSAGAIVGTLAYMSPEQAAGAAGSVDGRSDVYALGVCAYELLSGRLPLEMSGKGLAEAVRLIRDEEPTRLSATDRRLGGDVETIIGKALEKERDRRYASPAAFAADIRRYLAKLPVAARPPSTWYQLTRFAQRNKVLVGGAAAVLVTAVAGAAVATRFAFSQREAAARATLAEESTRHALDRSRFQLAELAARRGDWRTAAATYRDAIAAGTRLPVDARVGLVRALQNSGEKPAAVKELDALVRDFPAAAERPDVLYWQGQVAWMTREAEAERLFERALAPAPDRPPLAPADREYALGLLDPDVHGAIAHFRAALAHDFFHYDARGSLFATLLMFGDFEPARRECETWRALYPDDPMPDVGDALVEALAGRPEASARAFDRARGRFAPDVRHTLDTAIGILRDFRAAVDQPFEYGQAILLIARVTQLVQSYDGRQGALPTEVQFPRVFRRMSKPALDLLAAFNPLATFLPGATEKQDRAIGAFAKAYPTNAALTYHGIMLVKGGDYDGAADVFRRATTAPSLVDRRPLASTYLVHVLAVQMTRLKPAEREPVMAEFRRAVRLALDLRGLRDNPDPHNRQVLVEDCLHYGMETEAREFIDQWVAERSGNDPVPRLSLARLEFLLGNDARALRLVDELIKSHPGAKLGRMTPQSLREKIVSRTNAAPPASRPAQP